MTKVWRFLSVSIVAAVCLGLMLVPAVWVSAGDPPAGQATFQLPAVVNVTPGDAFTVNVTIYNPHNINISTAAMDLMWSDASMLNVTAIDNLVWPTYLACDWDNTTGEAWYAGGGTTTPGQPKWLNGTNITHCQVHFVAGSSEGIVAVNFTPLTENGETSLLDYEFSNDVCNWTAGVMRNMTVKIGSPTLTVNVTPTGKGTVNISGVTPSSYPNTTNWSWDEVINLTAVNSVANWTFDHWSGALSGSANPTNITMASAKSVVAHFVRYHLTVTNSTGGTVTAPGVGTFGYGEAENVTLVATNYTGYHFANWTGGVSTIGDVNASSTFINMTGNYSICANFAINQYNLTISSSTGGNVTTPGEGTFGPYAHGTVVNLTTTPDATYNFVNWTGNVGTIANGTAANTTINMTGNYSICANFAIGGATLEGHVSFNGRGSPPASRWIENFTVRFFQGGSEMVWSPKNATTNNTGVFTLPGIDPGTYNVSIKNWTCLSEVVTNVTLTAGNTAVVNFGTTREGDCNGDDWVTLEDRSLLYAGWDTEEVIQGGHYCDLNRDGWLTLEDRSLMYANWDQGGD